MPDSEFDLNIFAIANRRELSGLNLYEPSKPLGVNVCQHLISVTAGLSDGNYRILSAYTLLPSILCNTIPIVHIKGVSGSGKSQLLIAISDMLGNHLVAGNSTPASIKNVINKMRWSDPETLKHEKNCHLLLDNANSDTFADSNILGAFLNGYNRRTDRQYISQGNGQNIEFKVFCPKLITSVWDFDQPEMLRRLLVIKTSKTSNLVEVIDPNDINFGAIKEDLTSYWFSESKSLEFRDFRSAIKLSIKSLNSKHSKEKWSLVADLITTGCVTEIWNDFEAAAVDFEVIFDSQLATKTLLEVIISDAIVANLGITQIEWSKMSSTGIRLEVNPKIIKDAIDENFNLGLIARPSLTKIQELLTKLGFRPVKHSGNKIMYRYCA